MKKITQSPKRKVNTFALRIFFTFLISLTIFISISIKQKSNQNSMNNFGVMYSGENKMSRNIEPSKLRWIDPFKNIDNMKNKRKGKVLWNQ